MNGPLNSTMREAMRLMQTGDLVAATAAIQQQLGGNPEPASPGAAESTRDAIEAAFRVLDETPPEQDAASDSLVRSTPNRGRSPFSSHEYTGAAGSRRYKLFVPTAYKGQPLPLIVMLHGCTQGPDDFATGTRMNILAEERSCFVVYPAQSQSANISKCWNWFKASDQGRDQGEPAIIAGLVRELSLTYGVDRERVYVAGLSAGAAMAVILGRTYPEMFAAVGVHSGLPYAAAHDVPSAFTAMHRTGTALPRSERPGDAQAWRGNVPTIVFHGDRDTTVHPSNGERVASETAAVNADDSSIEPSAGASRPGQVAGGYSYTCTTFKDDNEKIVVEYWLVHGAAHAWFGGDPRGSYTDIQGPDASREMLRFFLERARVSDQ